MEKKRIGISALCILIGIAISIISGIWWFQKELVNFVGAGFCLGGMIYIDSVLFRKKVHENNGYRFRLLAYLLLGICLLLGPIKLCFGELILRVCKAIGEAFLLTALWNFFADTTIERKDVDGK